MKRIAIVLLVLGLVAATLLIAWSGFDATAAVLMTMGWSGFALICAFHFGLIALNGMAWHLVTPDMPPHRLPFFIWGRWVRTAAADILPFSQLAGPLAGVRLAILHGVSGATAAASVMVDVATEFLTQLGFGLIGLVILLERDPSTGLVAPALLWVLAAGAMAAAFIAVQHGSGRPLLERLSAPIARRFSDLLPATMDSVYAALSRIHNQRLRVALAALLHLLEWLGTGLEAWIALRLMQVPISLAGAIGIEGLLYAIRGAAFAVPAAVGIQEGGYLLLGAAFGLSPEEALALSLLKRGRDLVVGVPALLSWQTIEGSKVWRRLARRVEPEPRRRSGDLIR